MKAIIHVHRQRLGHNMPNAIIVRTSSGVHYVRRVWVGGPTVTSACDAPLACGAKAYIVTNTEAGIWGAFDSPDDWRLIVGARDAKDEQLISRLVHAAAQGGPDTLRTRLSTTDRPPIAMKRGGIRAVRPS